MFMGETQGMADFVDRGVHGPGVALVEVHRAIRLGDTENVSPNVGPVSTVTLESNSDLSFVQQLDFFEVQTDADILHARNPSLTFCRSAPLPTSPTGDVRKWYRSFVPFAHFLSELRIRLARSGPTSRLNSRTGTTGCSQNFSAAASIALPTGRFEPAFAFDFFFLRAVNLSLMLAMLTSLHRWTR